MIFLDLGYGLSHFLGPQKRQGYDKSCANTDFGLSMNFAMMLGLNDEE